MRPSGAFVALPFALFALISPTAASDQPAQWPHNLPRGQRYWPEHEHLVKREESARERLATETPIGMKKMSNDPNEMFFMHYWQFEGDDASSDANADAGDEGLEGPHAKRSILEDADYTYSNLTGPAVLAPALIPTTELLLSDISANRFARRNAFDKRSFQCPADTYACTSINRPNSCCANDENCQLVSNAGSNGDVGCCPKGQTCGGSVASCNTAAGYTSCPDSPNGGCCIPGYACQDVGCIASGYTTTTQLYVVTVTVTPGQPAAPVTTTRTPSLVAITTVVTVYQTQITQMASQTASPTPSVITVYTTLQPSQSTVVVYPTGYVQVSGSGSASCATGFQSCPASNGGGCCPNDHACPTSGTFCPPISTSTVVASTTVVGIVPPVRPTSDGGQSVQTLTTVSPAFCPTGYYPCSAFYLGGCCQRDRACDAMSCPAPVSATVGTDGATIVVPFSGATGSGSVVTVQAASTSTTNVQTGAASGVGQGQCASGWFQCDANAADGCCPGGYACAAANCLATNGGNPTTVNKIPVNAAPRNADVFGVVLVLVAAGLGFGMVLL